MTYKLMKSDLTAGQNGKQPKTTYPGLRATPASEACKSAESRACTNVNLFVLSSAPALSSPCLSAAGVGLSLTQTCTAKGCFSG